MMVQVLVDFDAKIRLNPQIKKLKKYPLPPKNSRLVYFITSANETQWTYCI